jgi:hypothetical protein
MPNGEVEGLYRWSAHILKYSIPELRHLRKGTKLTQVLEALEVSVQQILPSVASDAKVSVRT